MFIMSMKLEKRKMLVWSMVVVGLILVLICVWMMLKNKDSKKDSAFSCKNNAERVEFLESYGWQVSEEPIEVMEVILPAEFDETYTKYNEMQKAQGLDLTSFLGKRTKRWTYKVLNYPNDDSEIHANVIIYEDRVIAGDICSVTLGGFIHGFAQKNVGAFMETTLYSDENNIKPQIEEVKSGDIPNDAENVNSEAMLNAEEAKDMVENAMDAINENDSVSKAVQEVEEKVREELQTGLQKLLDETVSAKE